MRPIRQAVLHIDHKTAKKPIILRPLHYECYLLQTQGTGRLKVLDRDGIAAVGERVSAGDILINKQSPTSTKDVPLEQGPPTYKQMPVSWKAPQGESCYVDKVLLTQNDDANIVIKVNSLK